MPATFSGGVALGFATFFPAIAFATPPNVYGTADFGNNLGKALTIDIDPVFTTTEVSFALFNGETFNQSYVVDAFNGTTLVANQTLANVAPNFNSGYGLIDLITAGGITKVTIAPTGAPSAWEFLIDTVAFNQSVTTVVDAPPPPVVQPPTPPVRGHRHGITMVRSSWSRSISETSERHQGLRAGGHAYDIDSRTGKLWTGGCRSRSGCSRLKETISRVDPDHPKSAAEELIGYA